MIATTSPIAAFLDCLPDPAVLVDRDGVIQHFNQRFTDVVAAAGQALVGIPLARFLRGPLGGDPARLIDGYFAKDGPMPMTLGAVVGRRGRRGVRCAVSIGRIVDGTDLAYLFVLRDDGLDQQRQQRLAEAARTDALTGLLNRSSFTEEMELAIQRARRSQQRLALLFIDLDRFKEVNDGHGHDSGDTVLSAIARRFASGVRAGDRLCRWGGDEFACLLTVDGDERAAIDVAERLLEEVSLPVEVDDGALAVGASIGIARLPQDALTAGDLLSAADQALYEAKARGGMQWQSFAPAMAARSRDRSELRDEMSRALRSGELQLYYQPLVDAEHLRPVGVEALIRWVHPTRGVMGPAKFLTLLTSSPERALHLLQIQIDRALQDLDVIEALAPSLAINFDARLVGHGDARAILEPLRRVCAERGIALMIELTEAAFNEQPDRLQGFIATIRRDGMQLAIDDFGGGQASLLRLREITFDVLKVDRAFIHSLELSARDRTISALAAKVAGELSATSVAEGVETAAQIAWARVLGYHALQGYRIARPMPASELARWRVDWPERLQPPLVGEIEALRFGAVPLPALG